MKKSFGRVVNEVIEQSDVVLEIVDARFIAEMRNQYIEEKIRQKGKIRIMVVNKSDYLNKEDMQLLRKTLKDAVFVSSTKRIGIAYLFSVLKKKKKQLKMSEIVVGVIGYPNVGKSSLINALKGKRSARTSPEAGFTKGKQYLRIAKDLFMIDTPGVMAIAKKHEGELTILGAKNPGILADPDLAVLQLLTLYPHTIEKHYGVASFHNKEKIIEAIALKYNMKIKNGMPDIERTSQKILRDWQKGKIKASYHSF